MIYETIRFGDLYAVDSRNGLTKPSKVRGSGYKMINMGELFSNDRIYDIPMELVPLNDKEKSNAKVEIGDLLFARQSLVLEGAGKCSIVMDVSPLTVFESHLIRVRLISDANPMFYYYYFRSPLSPIKTIVSQCAQAGIRGSDLQELNVIFPPKEKQDKIANILSKYDNLIENNQKQIKLLEEAAQRLYKEWFVDLRFSGHEDVTIIDGVPEGWRKDRLGNCVVVKRGGSPRPIQDYLTDKGLNWLKISDATSANGYYILDIKEHIIEAGLNKTVMLKKGSLVLSNSATPGIPKILDVDSCIHDGWLYFSESYFTNEFLFLLFLQERANLIALGTGAVFTNLKTDIVKNYSIIVPNKDVLDEFQKRIEPIFVAIKNKQNTIKKLSEARDRLLSKLMSGGIEV